jgi:hypothetical protein
MAALLPLFHEIFFAVVQSFGHQALAIFMMWFA